MASILARCARSGGYFVLNSERGLEELFRMALDDIESLRCIGFTWNNLINVPYSPLIDHSPVLSEMYARP